MVKILMVPSFLNEPKKYDIKLISLFLSTVVMGNDTQEQHCWVMKSLPKGR